MEIIISSAYFLLLLGAIFRFRFFEAPGISKRFIAAVFGLKVMLGIVMFWLYSFHYIDRSKADIFKYFDDGLVMHSALTENPADYFKMLFGVQNDQAHFHQYYGKMQNWYREYESNLYNDNHTIIRFNAFIRLFSFGYYQVHSIFMCFVSLIGLTALYKAFALTLANVRVGLIGAVFLLPSVMFWGSGVLKEGLLLFALGLFVYHYFQLLAGKKSVWRIVVALFSVLILAYVKFYVLIALFVSILAHFICHLRQPRRPIWTYLSVATLCLAVGLNIHHFVPSLNFIEILVIKQKDFYGLATAEASGSLISIPLLEPNAMSFAKNLPEALFNVLLQPLPWNNQSIVMWMASLENLLLLALAVICLVFSKRLEPSQQNHFFFSIFFVLVLYGLIGLVTPVVGALVRYKVPALPFFVILFLLILDPEKLKKHLPWKLK